MELLTARDANCAASHCLGAGGVMQEILAVLILAPALYHRLAALLAGLFVVCLTFQQNNKLEY